MKVSIIIPVYNVEPYIESCLESVINQTYKDIEIILIDDCGKDNSINIAKQIIDKYNLYNKIKIIKHQYNKGLSAARNTGINNAIGEYIYFLDSDDTIPLNCIELLINPTTKFNYDFIIGNYTVYGNTKKYPSLSLPKGKISTSSLILEHFVTGKWYVMACNKLINKDFIIKNSLYFKEGLLHEDELWSFQLACCANHMYVIKNTTYNYFIRCGSITQNFNKKNIDSLIKIVFECIDYSKNNNLLSNINIYNYIESFKLNILYKIIKTTNYRDSYNTYKLFRQSYSLSTDAIKNIIYNKIQKQIRDLHYLLPKPIGYILLYIFLKIKSINRNDTI